MFKKGQAAMEFLMTYGWAILVVLAAIAALAYFGVLSPAKMLPERCIGPSGLDCIEKASMVGNTISWATKNNLGNDIMVTALVRGSSTDNQCSAIASNQSSSNGGTTWNQTDKRVNNGAYISFRLDCTTTQTSRVHGEFVVEYTSVTTGVTSTALYSIDVKKG